LLGEGRTADQQRASALIACQRDRRAARPEVQQLVRRRRFAVQCRSTIENQERVLERPIDRRFGARRSLGQR
jgi:hypothetical protein